MPRIDDYKEALRIAKEKLASSNIHHLAGKAGARVSVTDDGSIEMQYPFLGIPVSIRVDVSSGQVAIFRTDSEEEISLTDQILIAHYALNASGEPETGEWITFRDIPSGHFYFDAFQRRARDPFLRTFGSDPDLFAKTAPLLGGVEVKGVGDLAYEFTVFPRIKVRIVLWRGDEEFEPEATILFDRNIDTYLPTEDIAYLSGAVVYRLMGIARSMKG
ncbi:DUF3786 domain-containing protein [Thermodesulforhabdus norvegica]|uniref:DUF3786 domain-containing protein n=1 Tax=Thermodesulforhabdus norvegica TaxID=39841 RepID=A0A1I4S4G3_9BACT|nr:DUF3786 domain-containing protein [Thermodesulforhabdus norvegica]SFM59184.1 protein of unknown function [Thermodesulforhabdus norvegica]